LIEEASLLKMNHPLSILINKSHHSVSNIILNLVIGLHIVREVILKEPKAITIALENLAKISGCSVQAQVNLTSQDENVSKSIQQA
jgi:hypothetical protein